MLVQNNSLDYPLGNDPEEQLLNLYELKHTAVSALFALLADDPDVQANFEARHLMTLYHESHLKELQLLQPSTK